MTEKEIRRLSRADLLEMLIDQSRELNELRSRLEAAEKELQYRQIVLQNAGSIAEAALKLNGVFEAAQAACDQYVESVRLQGEAYLAQCRPADLPIGVQAGPDGRNG